MLISKTGLKVNAQTMFLQKVAEISLKHTPLHYKEEIMQMRLRCSCRRNGCKPGSDLYLTCPSKKIYYESFKYRGKFHGRSLGTGNEREAIAEIAIRFKDLEKGVSPKLNKTFKQVLEDYYFWAIDESQKSDSALADIKGRIRANLLPAFAEFKISEITRDQIKLYKAGRDEEGAAKGTIKKELDILGDIVRLFEPSFIMPEFKRWANPGKKVSDALKDSEVLLVGDAVRGQSKQHGETYWRLFWLMAYTGMDISDALTLKKSEVIDRQIFKDRGKTKKKIDAYLVPQARRLIADFQIVDISGRYFTEPSSKAVSVAIKRAFKDAGVVGNSKALRHFAATQYSKAGLKKATIRKVLGHAVASRIVDDYIHEEAEIMDNAYEGLTPHDLQEKAEAM